jgi:hypothetical protein
VFDRNILADYIATTGDLRHPLTRRRFSNAELLRLTRLTGKCLNVFGLEGLRASNAERASISNFILDDVSHHLQRFQEMVAIVGSATPGQVAQSSAVHDLISYCLSYLFPNIVLNVLRADAIQDDGTTMQELEDRYNATTSQLVNQPLHDQIKHMCDVFYNSLRDRVARNDPTMAFGMVTDINIGVGMRLSIRIPAA